MESRAPSGQSGDRREGRAVWLGSIKVAVGLGLLGVLFLWGRIDLQAFSGLAESPLTVIACTLLIFLLLPLGALRWGLLLEALEISLPFAKLFHFVSIGMVLNLFLLGSVGGDAARGLYVWRAVGHGSSRIAVSLVVDRLCGMLALLSIAVLFTALNWHWMRHIPALAALGMAVFLFLAAAIAGVCSLFYSLRSAPAGEERLSRWPRLAGLVGRARNLILLVRTRPWHLLAAFALSLVIHACVVTSIVMVAAAAGIGELATSDYMFAVPLTLVANAVPLTPNGIGVGEAAFDQICRWLEPVPTGAAYSSIFFAFRAISMLACLPGFVSFALYRNVAKPAD
jgi:glycosyltransferase 2 family protein